MATPPPFLTYLTVFKSRLGLANMLLAATGFAHQSDQALTRKIRRVLEERIPLDLGASAHAQVFSYLDDKRIVGSQPRKAGRYAGYALFGGAEGWHALDRKGNTLDAVPVFRTDIWLSDPQIPSTIGVPTPENASETVELGLQLRLLSRSKNTWTAAGQMVTALRDISSEGRPDGNPFLLRLESVALLRQLVTADGILLREVVRWLDMRGGRVSRDEVASEFTAIVDRAYDTAREHGVTPPVLRQAREFRDRIRTTRAGSTESSGGPGVLEHRVSPRLEWLTDLGYLSKEGLPKNAFRYQVTGLLRGLLNDLDASFGEDQWADQVATNQWKANLSWRDWRHAHACLSPHQAVREAYRCMQRRIGPAPIGEVAFIATLLREDAAPYSTVRDELIEFAQQTDGVSLSGGRYSRSPENIHMSNSALSPVD